MTTLLPSTRLIVKVGSALLVDSCSRELRQGWLRSLASDIAELHKQEVDIVVVSSGAIALGQRGWGPERAELTLEQSQAAAAVGQIRLARAWEDALSPFGIIAAQILVTLEDSANRRRFLNCRATLGQLLKARTIPIVNENDTVATDEIRFGDNDRLAAQMAMMVGADRLILLGDTDGFYNANPTTTADAKRFDVIREITPTIEKMAGDAGSGLSRGGMKTKLQAARVAAAAGCTMAIAPGGGDYPLTRLKKGGPATWFPARTDPQTARKQWITAMKWHGILTVDEGAARALKSGKSLLPAGVRSVEGMFNRGDAVRLINERGVFLGQGLCRYTAAEARKIKGRQSREIEGLLGYPGRAVIIHRDDLAFNAQ